MQPCTALLSVVLVLIERSLQACRVVLLESDQVWTTEAHGTGITPPSNNVLNLSYQHIFCLNATSPPVRRHSTFHTTSPHAMLCLTTVHRSRRIRASACRWRSRRRARAACSTKSSRSGPSWHFSLAASPFGWCDVASSQRDVTAHQVVAGYLHHIKWYWVL